jgi:hypothetical protein
MEIVEIAFADTFYVFSAICENTVGLSSELFVPVVMAEMTCEPDIRSRVMIYVDT